MRILKLPAKILYYVSDEFNKIFENVFLCVSIQIAARISTGKSDMLDMTHRSNINNRCMIEYMHSVKVKHHPNFISETFFTYEFFQKNNQFVIFCYPSLCLVCQAYQNTILRYCVCSTVSVSNDPYFEVYP